MSTSTDLGYIRKEVAASFVDARKLKSEDSREIKLNLRMPKDITTSEQRLVTTSLVDPATGTYFTIPAGARVTKVEVRKTKSTDLDTALTMSLGYSCKFIQDTTRKATLATRIVGTAEPVAGKLLNQHSNLVFDQTLYATQVAAQNTLYDAEMTAQSLTARTAIDYDIVASNTTVGESRPLIPVCTVLEGTLLASDVEFVFTYFSS